MSCNSNIRYETQCSGMPSKKSCDCCSSVDDTDMYGSGMNKEHMSTIRREDSGRGHRGRGHRGHRGRGRGHRGRGGRGRGGRGHNGTGNSGRGRNRRGRGVFVTRGRGRGRRESFHHQVAVSPTNGGDLSNVRMLERSYPRNHNAQFDSAYSDNLTLESGFQTSENFKINKRWRDGWKNFKYNINHRNDILNHEHFAPVDFDNWDVSPEPPTDMKQDNKPAPYNKKGKSVFSSILNPWSKSRIILISSISGILIFVFLYFLVYYFFIKEPDYIITRLTTPVPNKGANYSSPNRKSGSLKQKIKELSDRIKSLKNKKSSSNKEPPKSQIQYSKMPSKRTIKMSKRLSPEALAASGDMSQPKDDYPVSEDTFYNN